MNLNKEELVELNKLLANRNLDLPQLRREVSPNGTNYQWLRRNIWIRNKGRLTKRLCELLHLKDYINIADYIRTEPQSPAKSV